VPADIEGGTIWERYRRWVVEWFVVANLGFLALDIYLAHSVNEFAHRAEWIPFYFSLLAPIALIGGMLTHRKQPGALVGVVSIGVGVAGLVLHLDSHFFETHTLEGLVYAAPFAAPLAYAGLGLLLLLDRMVPDTDPEWAAWVIFLALGGFVGNFALALCDHAINGFFEPAEWIPVFAAALAVGFLGSVFIVPPTAGYLVLCLWVLVVQVAVGLAGFGLHVMADFNRQPDDWWASVVHGAPPFAPLLFCNLAVLAAVGLWDMRCRLSPVRPRR